jgi:hypothetical protein
MSTKNPRKSWLRKCKALDIVAAISAFLTEEVEPNPTRSTR